MTHSLPFTWHSPRGTSCEKRGMAHSPEGTSRSPLSRELKSGERLIPRLPVAFPVGNGREKAGNGSFPPFHVAFPAGNEL